MDVHPKDVAGAIGAATATLITYVIHQAGWADFGTGEIGALAVVLSFLASNFVHSSPE